MRAIAEIRSLIRQRSLLPVQERETIIAKRFAALPKRLTYAAERWPLERARVLDVGCSYGHCLIHFGPGSVGLDNVREHVDFCHSLGLDARLADVEGGLDVVEDGVFDVVWVSDILEHLDAPRLLLRSAAAKLGPDGRLIAFVNVLPRSRLACRVLRGRGWFDADAHHYQFSVQTARYLFERAGYRVEQVVVHLLPRSLDPVAGAFAALAPVVFVSARPDRVLQARALGAERRNKPVAAAVTIMPVNGRQESRVKT
jgi:SAM-dependent methyltransferase